MYVFTYYPLYELDIERLRNKHKQGRVRAQEWGVGLQAAFLGRCHWSRPWVWGSVQCLGKGSPGRMNSSAEGSG